LQADMRDLSCLEAESFDLVFQAPSMSYIPDVRQVYTEVARVLRTGGNYRVAFSNPATEFVDWDGEGYRIRTPYAERTRRRSDGVLEFRHYLCDIFTGLLDLGLTIQQVLEEPHYQRQDARAPAGSWAHYLRYVAGFILVVRKA